MSRLTSTQCLSLANQLSVLQAEIGDYKHTNFLNLSVNQKEVFRKTLKNLSDAAGMLFAFTVVIALDEAKTSISNLESATNEINNILKTIGKVQKWINIAGASFGLATALLEHNPQNIFNGIKEVIKSIEDANN